jgi:hypothetical protein
MTSAKLPAEVADMDIGDWLTRLGFSQYEAAFRENAIDAEVLRELTDEHLRDLGVPLGSAGGVFANVEGKTLRPHSWKSAGTPNGLLDARRP